MKNGYEKAQVLLEAMDQVNDELLQRAYDVDTAEKFHALRKTAVVRMPKDRSITRVQRNAAIAACLAVALLIAFGGVGLALLLPGTLSPNPTNPPPMTQPTQTSPTEPIDTELPILTDITISNGNCSTVLSLYAMKWTELFEESSSIWQRNDGNGADDIMYRSKWDEELTSIPEVFLNSAAGDTVALALPKNAVLNDIRLYFQRDVNSYQEVEDFPDNVEALLNVRNGPWVVVFSITWQGHHIESENRYEQHCYEYVFTLDGAIPTLDSGTCGENATWEFNPATGTLTISGSGKMDTSHHPWYAHENHIKNLVIEDGITEICDFDGLQNLSSVQIPNSVHALPAYAFARCTSLETIILPDSIQTIGNRAFFKCTKLQSIQLPNNLSTISEAMFAGCSSLQSIKLPKSITNINEFAFSSCFNLYHVTFSKSITSIDAYAFQSCAFIELNLPDSLQSIGDHCFANCNALKKVSIGPNVTTILSNAFSGCQQLEKVTIHPDNSRYFTPDGSVIYANVYFNIDGSSFEHNSRYRVLLMVPGFTGAYTVLPGTAVIHDYAFYQCQNLTSVTLPDTVSSIGQYAFGYCTQLQSVQLSENLQIIRSSAFNHCTALTELTIPASVRTIEASIFYNCEELRTITFLGDPPDIDEYAFSTVTARIYYPVLNSKWTDDKRTDYGGTRITWAPNPYNNTRRSEWSGV